jgi:hypothetical protein
MSSSWRPKFVQQGSMSKSKMQSQRAMVVTALVLRGRGSSRVGGREGGQATSVCPWSKKSSTINDEAESADFSSPASVRRTKGLAGI